ncbi:zmpB [Symbiodinium sp. KB8]|nr:zmpB [Symbiodinium sp. KB8]
MKNCLGSCPHLAPPEYQQEPPAEHAPAEHPPAPPVEQAPVEQAPPDQAPPEQAPPEQAPPEQAPPEQAPPEQVSAEQAPPEQVPAEQAPPEQQPPPMEQPPQPTEQPPVQEPPVVDEVCENGVCPGGGGELPPVVQQVHPTPEGKKDAPAPSPDPSCYAPLMDKRVVLALHNVFSSLGAGALALLGRGPLLVWGSLVHGSILAELAEPVVSICRLLPADCGWVAAMGKSKFNKHLGLRAWGLG